MAKAEKRASLSYSIEVSTFSCRIGHICKYVNMYLFYIARYTWLCYAHIWSYVWICYSLIRTISVSVLTSFPFNFIGIIDEARKRILHLTLASSSSWYSIIQLRFAPKNMIVLNWVECMWRHVEIVCIQCVVYKSKDNKEWTIQRHWQHLVHKTHYKDKQNKKHNTENWKDEDNMLSYCLCSMLSKFKTKCEYKAKQCLVLSKK